MRVALPITFVFTLFFLLVTLSQAQTQQTQYKKLPRMAIMEGGYVDVQGGHWEPTGSISGDDIEITCIRARAPQLSNSEIGYCLLAYAFALAGTPVVKTDYLDITNWNKTRIIAEHSAGWELTECEKQIYVLDFPTNTVTLTSTLNKTDSQCAKRWAYLDKMSKDANKPPMKDVEVFHLAPGFADMPASKDANPFLR
jgi:hypothetical protein